MPLFNFIEEPGNYYAYLIEGRGDDANDGLTPETAVATFNRLITILDTYAGTNRRVAVIDKFIIDETITYVRNVLKPITFNFIKKTFFKAVFVFTGRGDIIKNAKFEHQALTRIVSIDNRNKIYFEDCYLKYCEFFGGSNLGVEVFINRCYVEKCSMSSAGSNHSWYLFIYNSIINGFTRIGASGGGTQAGVLKNSIVHSFLASLGTNSEIDYNCIIGPTAVQLVTYSNNDLLVAAGYNENGIASDPQYNSFENKVFSLNSSSPCLYRGENGDHIGFGEAFYLSPTELFNNAERLDNFQLQSQKLLRVDDTNDALLETYTLNIGGTRQINIVELFGNLSFIANDIQKTITRFTEGYIAYDSLITYHTGSTVTDSTIKYLSLIDNNLGNTPASSPTQWERMTWLTGVSYAAGKIVQYTDDKWYKANTATSTSCVAGEWDEVLPVETLNFALKYGRTYSECQAASWKYFKFNELLLEDSAGKGDADNDYDILTGASIRFNYFKLLIHAKTVR